MEHLVSAYDIEDDDEETMKGPDELMKEGDDSNGGGKNVIALDEEWAAFCQQIGEEEADESNNVVERENIEYPTMQMMDEEEDIADEDIGGEEADEDTPDLEDVGDEVEEAIVENDGAAEEDEADRYSPSHEIELLDEEPPPAKKPAESSAKAAAASSRSHHGHHHRRHHHSSPSRSGHRPHHHRESSSSRHGDSRRSGKRRPGSREQSKRDEEPEERRSRRHRSRSGDRRRRRRSSSRGRRSPPSSSQSDRLESTFRNSGGFRGGGFRGRGGGGMTQYDHSKRRLEKIKKLGSQAADAILRELKEKPELVAKLNDGEVAAHLNADELLKNCDFARMNEQEIYQTAMSEMRKKTEEITGVKLPTFYAASAMNPLRMAELQKKRQLLWANAGQNKTVENKWQASAAALGDDKTADKFRNLLGMKAGESSINESVDSHIVGGGVKEEQMQLMNDLDSQYAQARVATHMQRGVGLGFSSLMAQQQQTNPPK